MRHEDSDRLSDFDRNVCSTVFDVVRWPWHYSFVIFLWTLWKPLAAGYSKDLMFFLATVAPTVSYG
jgi:hypothetical protein